MNLLTLRHSVVALVASVLLVSAPAYAQEESQLEPTIHLTGTIGTLPVRIELQRNGNDVFGSYVYETAKPTVQSVLTELFLSGTVDASGAIALEETITNPNGEDTTTGRIKGTLGSTGGVAKLSGTWTRPDGSKPLPVSATETVAGSGLHVAIESYKDSDKRYDKILTARYPKLDGDSAGVRAFNAEVKRMVANAVAEYKDVVKETEALEREPDHLAYDISPEVTFLNDRLVSVVFETYEDFAGAHPGSSSFALTFDLEHAKAVELADLFKNKKGYLAQLSTKARPLAPKSPDLGLDLSPDPVNYGTWFLTKNGLYIVAEIAHVFGDQAKVYLPYASLQDMLDPSGPAGAVLK